MTALGRTDLSNLPVELLEKIATQCHAKDLRALASTNHFFREVTRPLIDTLRLDPARVFAGNYYTTLSEKIRAYTSLAEEILEIKEVVTTSAAIITGAAAVATAAIAGVISVARGRVTIIQGGATVIEAARAVAEEVAPIAIAAVEKIAHLLEEKRRYLEICQESRALSSLTRTVIREDLSFLPPTELFNNARIVYQSANPARTLRFLRAFVEQLVRSSSPLAELQRLLPPHFESKLHFLRENYNKLWNTEKSAFSLHAELSAVDGPSITLQNLVLDGRELADEIAHGLPLKFLTMIVCCAREL